MLWSRRSSPFEVYQEDERFGLFQIFLLLVVLALLAALFYGFTLIFEKVDPLLFLAGSVALVFAMALVTRLEYGVVAWIALGPILTLRVVNVAGGGTGGGLYPSMLILSLLLGAWFMRMLLDQRIRVPSVPFNVPFAMLCIWTALCIVAGNVFWEPFVRTTHRILAVQAFCSGMFFMALGTIWLVGYNISSEKMLRYYFKALIFIALWTLLMRFGGALVPVIPYDPLVRTHGGAVAAAYYFVARTRRGRMTSLFVTVACLLSVFLEFFGVGGGQWLSGWVALVVPVIIVIFLRSRRMFSAGFIMGAMFLVAASPYLVNMYNHAESEGDFNRFEVWGRSFRMAWRHNLLFGVGPGNFWDYHDSYFGASMSTGLTSAHGQYQQIVAETGWIGLLLTGWLILSIYRYMIQVMRRTEDPLLSSIVIGAIGSVTGVFLASIFGDYLFPTYHNAGYQKFSTTICIWVVIGGVVAVDQVLRRQKDPETPS